MNVYAVCIPEERVEYFGGLEPPEVGVPLGLFAAETEGQARCDALKVWLRRRCGVNSDDFVAIRSRVVWPRARNLERGEIPDSDPLWKLWPEGWPVV